MSCAAPPPPSLPKTELYCCASMLSNRSEGRDTPLSLTQESSMCIFGHLLPCTPGQTVTHLGAADQSWFFLVSWIQHTNDRGTNGDPFGPLFFPRINKQIREGQTLTQLGPALTPFLFFSSDTQRKWGQKGDPPGCCGFPIFFLYFFG